MGKMTRVILRVFVLYLLLPRDVLSAHRTAASRHKSIHSHSKSKTSSMRSRMMEVLHLRDANSLSSMFDVEDEDPVYAFVLPDKRNKTIVFHQRDFTQMEYPRISEVGRMEGPVFYKPLNAPVFRDESAPLAERLTVREEGEEEAEMNRIVEENVRTERNFIQFMEDLNEKEQRPKTEKSSKALKHPPSTPSLSATQQQKMQQRESQKPTASALRFQHFGDQHFHPDLFHNPRHKDKLEESIQPPPLQAPTSKFNRDSRAGGKEEEEEGDDYDEDYEEDVADYRGKKKVNQKPGYGNIGEVVSPPFHDDSADRSDEFISELKIVPKLRNTSKKLQQNPRKLPPGRHSTAVKLQRQGAAYDRSLPSPSSPTPTLNPYPKHRQKPDVYESRKIETGHGGGPNGGWDDFGLDGWTGGLSDPVEEFEEKPEPSPSSSDIFHQGITYNRMKEMFHKNVQYSYQQQHPEPAEYQYQQHHHQNQPSYYQETPTRDIRKPSDSENFNKPALVTHLSHGYGHIEEDEEADEEDGYRYNSHEGHGLAQQQYSHEYVPPRTRTKYQSNQAPYYDVREQEEEAQAEVTHEPEPEEDIYGAEETTEEEYVYMINGKPISLELAELLQNEHTSLNFTRQVKRPSSQASATKYHLTSSRSAHSDSDVFVARANNPFGHSTKWEWSNATASYVVPHSSKKNKKRGGRQKRGVSQLYSMVKCATGCDPIVYKGYGCYCGFLGQGEPLDGIDKCCKLHDDCYTNSGCPSYLEYFVPYLWKCYKGQPLCAVSHGEWGDANSCAARLCQCDLKLSMCLRRYYCPRKRNVCQGSPWRLLQNFIMDF